MGKERRLSQPCCVQPAPCPVGTSSESFELLHCPSDEVFVDARRDGVQLGAVEGPVVVDPAAHLGIDLPGEAGQVRAAATVEVPGSDPATLRLPRHDAHGRQESHEEPVPTLGQASPKGIAEEVKARVLKASPAFRGRVAGGIAAPGSHRSRRESLPSPGSSHPSVSQ